MALYSSRVAIQCGRRAPSQLLIYLRVHHTLQPILFRSNLAVFSTVSQKDSDSKTPPSSTPIPTENEMLEEGGIGDKEIGSRVHAANHSSYDPKPILNNSKNELFEEGGIGDKDLGKHVHSANLLPPYSERKSAISWLYYHHDKDVKPIYGPGTEGKKPNRFLGIFTAVNGLIFLSWAIVGAAGKEAEKLEETAKTKEEQVEASKQVRYWMEYHDWMLQNFSTNLHNIWEGRYWTLLTASFSHQTFPHIFGNMFAFWLFGHKTYRILGGAAFAGLYFVGGATSALAHDLQNLYHNKTDPPLTTDEMQQIGRLRAAAQQNGGKFVFPEKWLHRLQKADSPSLGASGSVMAIAAAAAMLFPRDRVISHLTRFIPLPLLLPLPVAVSVYIASDLYGLTLPDNIDHAGHLAGVATGVLYVLFQWYVRGRVHTKPLGHVPLLRYFRKTIYGPSGR